MHDPNCLFCKIIAGAIPCAKVFESENVLAFLDIEPIEKGHVLVIPKRHWARSQRRRVRQTRFAHPAPPAVTTLGAARKTQ